MALKFVPLDDSTKQQWDRFVGDNPHAWVGHHAAIIAFERAQGHAPLAHLALGKGDKVQAVCPLFITEERLVRYVPVRSLTTGCSLRGAPLLAAGLGVKKRRSFWREWTAWVVELARRQGVDQIRASFPHVFGEELNRQVYPYFPLRDFGFDQSANYTLLMDLRAAPPEISSLMKPETRKKIRQTLAAGVELVQISDRERWLGECDELNRQTFGSKALSAYGREVMEIVWDQFVEPGLAEVLGIEHEGQLLTVQVNVGTGRSYYYWLGFNRRPCPLTGSHSLLMLRCMERYRERGAAFFELGSMEFDDPSQRDIAQFKRSLGGEVYPALEGQLELSELKLGSLRWIQTLARVARREAARLRR
jgi:hypothetical protein